MSRAQGVRELLDAPDAATRIYRGRTVEELIPRIQEELGSDAIILGRREGLTGGIAGFFQRPFVEIEAMAGGPRVDVYDEQDIAAAAPYVPQRSFAPSAEHSHQPASQAPVEAPAGDPYAHEYRADPTPFYKRDPPLTRSDSSYVTESLAALARVGPLEPTAKPPVRQVSRTSEFQELTPMDLSDPFAAALEEAVAVGSPDAANAPFLPSGVPPASRLPPSAPAALPRSATPVGAPRSRPSPQGRARVAIESKLTGLGVSEQFAAELIDAAAGHILPFAPRTGLSQAVQSALAQRIPVAPPLPARGGALTLIGPGGSGKTSCCAALLGAYRKGSTLTASCATLVRGAKRDELQMLLSPHVMRLVPIDTQRAVRALRKTRSDGLLVIDTPALSPGERSGIRKLAGLLGELEPERVVVMLPATLSMVAAEQLLEALRPLGANALAVTHADETDQIGVAVEAACKFGLAPEYILDRGRSGGWRVSRIDPTGLAARLLQ